ncbi:helix-turn-helix transcriptional regulator [Microbispora sp. NPDC049125]|uniref:helix-turn-helix transcriptional regulator n=1 Tax=Microbispora sp. NPDC049125 TaxID=3154929 RepID=UPI0034664247
MSTSVPGSAGWSFLTNHAHVLLAIARDPDARLRDVAEQTGITERAVQGIVSDLEAAGYLRRERVGRRNHYTIDSLARSGHPSERNLVVGELLALSDGDRAQAGA